MCHSSRGLCCRMPRSRWLGAVLGMDYGRAPVLLIVTRWRGGGGGHMGCLTMVNRTIVCSVERDYLLNVWGIKYVCREICNCLRDAFLVLAWPAELQLLNAAKLARAPHLCFVLHAYQFEQTIPIAGSSFQPSYCNYPPVHYMHCSSIFASSRARSYNYPLILLSPVVFKI